MNQRAIQELDLLLQEGQPDDPLLAEGLVLLYAGELFRFAWSIFDPQTTHGTVHRVLARRAVSQAINTALDQLNRFQEQPGTFLWLLALIYKQAQRQEQFKKDNLPALAASLCTTHNLSPEDLAYILKIPAKRAAALIETGPEASSTSANGTSFSTPPLAADVPPPPALTAEETTTILEAIQSQQKTQTPSASIPHLPGNLIWIGAAILLFLFIVRAVPNTVITLPTPFPTGTPTQTIWETSAQPLPTATGQPAAPVLYEPENPYLIWQQTQSLDYGGTFSSLAFSPTAPLLAAGTDRGKIILWDTTDFSLIGELDSLSGQVQSLVFSPDGSLLAIGGLDQTIRLWEMSDDPASSGVLVQALEGQPNVTNSLVFSPDGSTLAAGSGDEIWLWRMDDGTKLRTWEKFDATILSVAFSPDGEWLAAEEADGTVWVLDSNNGNPLLSFEGTALYGVNLLSFSPDGKYLAAKTRKGSLMIIELQKVGNELEGVITRTLFKSDENFSGSEIQGYRYAPNGAFFAAITSEGVYLWETANWAPLQAPLGTYRFENPFKVLTISRDSKTIATGRIGEIQIWQPIDIQAQVNLLQTPRFFTRLENDRYTTQFTYPDPEEQISLDEANSGLSIEEASARAGFTVKAPLTDLLQGEYQFDGVYYDADTQTISMGYYSSYEPLPFMSFTVLQKQVGLGKLTTELVPPWRWTPSIGRTAIVVPIQQGNFYGEWLSGYWTTLMDDNPDIYNANVESQPGDTVTVTYRWANNSYSYHLRWKEEDILYEIQLYMAEDMDEETVRETALLLALSISAPEEIDLPSTTGSSVYTIQPGDTCTALAEQFSTTIETIISLNGLSEDCALIAGQTLSLPSQDELFAVTDMNCDGNDENLLIKRDSSDPTQILGLALEIAPLANFTERVWEIDARVMGDWSTLYEPELFSMGECEQFLAVRGMEPGVEGEPATYRTRIYRWNGTSMWPVLNTAGSPNAADGLIASLPQSSDGPFTISIIQYASEPHPTTGLCPNQVTQYTWNGQLFEKGQTTLVSSECLTEP